MSDLLPEEDRNPLEWGAIAIVLLIAVVPDVLGALSVFLNDQQNALVSLEAPESATSPEEVSSAILPFEHVVSFLISRSLWVSFWCLAVAWFSIKKLKSIGLIGFSWKRDLLSALLIYFLGTVAYYITFNAISLAGLNSELPNIPFAGPRIKQDYYFLIVGCLANGFAEELVMRGYLLTRFEKWFRSTWLAVIVSCSLFASYHIYQGVPSMLGIFALGIVYSVGYCYIRSLWPLVLAHAIADYVGFAMLPQ